MHGLADADFAAVRLLLAGDHAEERRLAGAVRADHADDAAGRQLELKTLDQDAIAIALGELLGVDDVLAEALAGRDDDLRIAGAAVVGGLDQLVLGAEARLRFCLPRLGR
jgi:hypothetical protein